MENALTFTCLQGELYGTKSQTVLMVSRTGEVMWHERTRVELVTDGENWETAHYVVLLDEHDPDEAYVEDVHTEL